ncbi:MAG: YggS family pyridoxal phosphate-dependent enzyme [Candidatus Eisenbacteria sp.]|nr:YggS family pyridoxal phosphate-dependent enzyme [Candidatus Eisenbacteria bacterium]
MSELSIGDRVGDVLASLPEGVLLVGAAKMRSPEEARAAIEAGLPAIGHNYVQQAETMRQSLSEWEARWENPVRWHLIGHLQRNKVKKAVALFDMIETMDSVSLAHTVDRHCADIRKVMSVLIEINSGRESSKTGVAPGETLNLAREISQMEHLRLQGLMTMGPRFGDPEDSRPYFRVTKGLFDSLSSADLGGGEMRYLSMGMSNSYRIAIEEGANIVRIGTTLFGERRA